ncbi:hypothetical protein LQZ18_17055 [Lachnospiraceae bacterium ZAX-1]
MMHDLIIGDAYMIPISTDKCKIIVATKERGEKPETIALWADVSVSSVYNICRLAKKKDLYEIIKIYLDNINLDK